MKESEKGDEATNMRAELATRPLLSLLLISVTTVPDSVHFVVLLKMNRSYSICINETYFE
jgi:hypothetical protein